jgi:hypothetical protein
LARRRRPSTAEFLGLKHQPGRKRLPQRTYWIRRAVALLVVAGVVAGIAFSARALVGEEDYGAGPPAQQTLKKSVWGLTEHDGESLFPAYRDLGVGLFTTQARWDVVAAKGRPRNPENWRDPAYDWTSSSLDKTIEEAQRHGIEVAIQIIGAPKWANGGRAWNYPPERASDYGDFAAAIAQRYPSVRHWMIWGEPNSKRAFASVVDAPMTDNPRLNRKQQRAPRQYAEIVDAAYGELKDVRRRNLVIAGNTYLSSGHPVIRPYQWIRYMQLPDGSRPRMDMWGHNPYSFRKPFLESPASPRGRVDFSDLDDLTATLDRTFPGPPLPLYLSEWGVPTGLDKDLEFEVDTDTAVKWVQAAFEVVRTWDRIYTLGWSVPVDTDRNPQGLLDQDLEPKATYKAFKEG